MKLQQARRTNPYPWTWEIPAAITAGALLVMALALHVARAIANVFAGGTFSFPARAALFSSLGDLLNGDATAGLPEYQAGHASSRELWFWIVVTELAVFTILGLILRWGMRQWGPGRIQGMASPSEADQLLGISRLRRNAAIIRPDLYEKGANA
ncbi:hypothetical protein GCM10022234_21930 [Aeromicrobium panaciterrae]|uniref:hypothetical protein n=1 Tax=Aeromicrobium panaciterrae TaxID=363861 RepID=UPI0031DDC229